MNFKNKVVVITGASSGIGRCLLSPGRERHVVSSLPQGCRHPIASNRRAKPQGPKPAQAQVVRQSTTTHRRRAPEQSRRDVERRQGGRRRSGNLSPQGLRPSSTGKDAGHYHRRHRATRRSDCQGLPREPIKNPHRFQCG